MTEYLLIPPSGILEVFETENGINVEAILAARGGEGVLATMRFDAEPGLLVRWYVNETGSVNPRARETLVAFGGPHAVFTGPVMFSGLPPEAVAEVVAHLSR